MIKEEGSLIVGVEFGGKRHKDFILRPQLVRDSIDAVEDPRAKKNESYLGFLVLARQIEKLGDIPAEKITPELLLNMLDEDLLVINEAAGRLQKRLRSFRGKDATPEDGGPSAA